MRIFLLTYVRFGIYFACTVYDMHLRVYCFVHPLQSFFILSITVFQQTYDDLERYS